MSTLKFNDLLSQVAAGQGKDIDQLTKERDILAKQLSKLEQSIAVAKSDLAKVTAKLQEPIRQAIKAASLIGVEVPEEYRIEPVHNGLKSSSGGAYRWTPGPLPGSTSQENLAPRDWPISRALWYLSKGSGGSTGKNGEGVLSAVEFWALVKTQTNKSELAVGESVTVEFPNMRKVKVSRLH